MFNYKGFCREEDHEFLEPSTELVVNGEVVKGHWITGTYVAPGLIAHDLEDTSNATGEYYGMTPYAGILDVIDGSIGMETPYHDINNKPLYTNDCVYSKNPMRPTYFGVIRFGEYGSDQMKACGFYIEWTEIAKELRLRQELPYWVNEGLVNMGPEISRKG